MTSKCPCCNGTGRKDLPEKLQAVVNVLEDEPLKTSTVGRIHAALAKANGKELHLTATSRAVERLINLGVVKRYGDKGSKYVVELISEGNEHE